MKKGDIVNIYNYTMGGAEFLEGEARLIKKTGTLASGTERWIVHFLNDRSGVDFERSINPNRNKSAS